MEVVSKPLVPTKGEKLSTILARLQTRKMNKYKRLLKQGMRMSDKDIEVHVETCGFEVPLRHVEGFNKFPDDEGDAYNADLPDDTPQDKQRFANHWGPCTLR